MKGLSAKKIAAIAAGVALVGTALAPFVSAMDLKKSDVYNETSGAPAVSVVVGSKAAISDVLWAGNIAAAIARNATASATATATATPSVCGAASGTWNPPTGMTVDLSVGGTTTLGAGSKQFKQNLSSVSGAVEVDHNALTNSTLTHLVNTTQTETVDNSQSTITAQETIGVNI
ncbi:MAG: S-layer protein, partial [archaeon]